MLSSIGTVLGRYLKPLDPAIRFVSQSLPSGRLHMSSLSHLGTPCPRMVSTLRFAAHEEWVTAQRY